MHRILDIVKYIVKIENGWGKIIKWYHGDIGIILMRQGNKYHLYLMCIKNEKSL